MCGVRVTIDRLLTGALVKRIGSVFISVISVQPPRPLRFCGESVAHKTHHRDAEDTEVAQRFVTLGYYHRIRRMLFALALFVLLSALVPHARVQASLPTVLGDAPDDDAALYQALLDLTNPWTVMCVAAHPDDEDGATLTVLRRKQGAHTLTLFSTNGEGGQNATGPELYEELGAIRVRETREASRVQGSYPYFLGLLDFGFSKSADEALRIWNHDEALRRMVLEIRRLRPDVIITNHDTSNGHGQHQATGRLVLEAFDAAADPARFPEQLHIEDVRVWQVQRLFVRVRYEGGRGSTAIEDEASGAGTIVSIDANERDPVRGSTYAQQALLALQRHASQGPWPQTVPAGGVPVIRYRLARSSKQAAPLPPHARSVLDGLRLPEDVAAALKPPTIDRRPLTDFVNQRDRLVERLTATSNQVVFPQTVSNDHVPRWFLMSLRLERARALLSKVTATLMPRDPSTMIVPSDDRRLSLFINNGGTKTVEVQGVNFNFLDQPGKSVQTPVLLPPKTSVIIPIDGHNIPSLLSVFPSIAPFSETHLSYKRYSADVYVIIDSAGVTVPVMMRFAVAPAIEIMSLAPSTFVMTPATVNQPTTFSLRITNHTSRPFAGRAKANLQHQSCHQNMCPDPELAATAISLAARETREIKMTIPLKVSYEYNLQGSAPDPFIAIKAPYSIHFTLERTVNDRYTLVSDTPTRVRVGYSEARITPNLRVGYVRSSDDTLRSALSALGVESKELTVDDIRAGDLKRYDTIIIDNRGYQAHPELIAANSRLLEYVHAGGTLIVFYHKTNEWNPDPQKGRPQLAPYTITLGGERVTDENAPVAFLDPQHALLNFPNKLTPDDFRGWIQERGLYYPKQWDEHYSAPLASNDAGEQPLRGGLLAADYGRGRYIYTSMVWYRQLRAGVPGAYRMFANMLSYGRANKSASVRRARQSRRLRES